MSNTTTHRLVAWATYPSSPAGDAPGIAVFTEEWEEVDGHVACVWYGATLAEIAGHFLDEAELDDALAALGYRRLDNWDDAAGVEQLVACVEPVQ